MDISPLDFQNLQQAIEGAVAVFGEHDRDAITHELSASLNYDSGNISTDPHDVHISNSKYFLAINEGEVAGITGYYQIEGHEEDIWLGWIGVLPEFQRRGLGARLVREAFNQASGADTGHVKNFRIWTTRKSQYDSARRLYAREGFIEESYKPETNDACSLIVVFSKKADPAFSHDHLWRDSSYAIDCENHEIPRLNREMLGDGDENYPQVPPSNIFGGPNPSL